MFYAHIVLAKKGPFARIWLAAHWDKKLTKAHVFETNIEQSVEGIMQPKVKLALRTSGHLLLGVVRIYSRKAKYLLADCNEAFVKIKMAFRPGMVDLPEEHREAAVNAITLPEVFHDFDTALPELNDVDIEAQFSINQSRADEITMREEYGSLPMSIHDDGFGDMGFDADEADFIRDDPNIDENLMSQDMDHRTNKHMNSEPMPGTSRSLLELQDNDGFGDDFGQPAAGLFEGDLFADAPLERREHSIPSAMEDKDSDDDMDGGWVGGAPSTPPSSPALSRPPSALATANIENADARHDALMPPSGALHDNSGNAANADENADDDGNFNEQTTLLNNEEESFALAPVDASALKGVTKAKRKRKLIVDEVKNISGEEMKSQLANTSDIITTLDLAPPTKRLMYWKDTGGVEKVFTLCTRDIKATVLFKNNQRHFVSKSMGIEDFSILGPADVLALEQHHNEPDANILNKRGRKRKCPTTQEPDYSMEPGPAAQDESAAMPMLENSSRFDLMPPPSVTPCFPDISTPSQSGMHSLPNIPMTPGNLTHGGITPSGLHHGGMTPMHGGMTPMHGGMTPAGMHSDFHSDLGHPAFTPAGLDHGGLTPHHGIENLDSIPNLPPDQVSSILNGTGMENMGFSNMGYDDGAHHTPQSGLSERIAEDWHHDYDFPPSVGPHQPGDEQMENETDEQFEERVLNKRAAQMFVSVRARMQKVDSIYLSDMTVKNNRKQAAQKFYSLLVLKKFQALDIKQDVAYGDILVTKGVMFDNPKL